MYYVKGFFVIDFKNKNILWKNTERAGFFYKEVSHFRIWKLTFVW